MTSGRATVHDMRRFGFTLIEVLVALAIAAVAVVVLVHLHLLSLSAVAQADAEVQALALAQEKIAELEATDLLEIGTRTGSVERNGVVLSWETLVSDLPMPGTASLRRITVTVRWGQGPRGPRQVVLSTAWADRRRVAQAR